MRVELETEISKLKTELALANEEDTKVRDQHAQEVIRLDQDYKHKNEQMKNMQSHYRKQVQIIKDENHSLNQVLGKTQEELQRERKEFDKKENQYKLNIANLEEKSATLADDLDRNGKRSSSVNILIKFSNWKIP